VDVISLSWGFLDDHPRIESALINAYQKNIIILAAASNHGLMDQIAFPARLRDYVICIGAARGDGTTASLTAEDPEYQSYTAPGIGVLGASVKRSLWGGYTTERKDGTSSATPIAAGIAALFIEYSRRNNLGEARSHENMLKLFSAISTETRNTYRLLRP
jgi:subtilisin family serine protease